MSAATRKEAQPVVSNSDYMQALGVIEYDPETKELNGKQVLSFTVRTDNKPTDVRVTVWPELKVPEGLLKKGLMVGVRGKYSQGTNRDGDKTYHNLSAQTVSVGTEVFAKEAAGTTQKPAGSTEAAF